MTEREGNESALCAAAAAAADDYDDDDDDGDDGDASLDNSVVKWRWSTLYGRHARRDDGQINVIHCENSSRFEPVLAHQPHFLRPYPLML